VDESNVGAAPAKRTRRSVGWRARPWSVAAFLLALFASLVLLFAPLGTRLEATAVPASRLLGVFVLLGAMSVGIYYVPAEAALIVGAAKERRQ